MNIKLIHEVVPGKDKKTDADRTWDNFFILTENGSKIAIKPTFKDGWNLLRLVAEPSVAEKAA